MAEQFDIDFVLRQWPFKPGVIAARLVRAGDGREVLQMRVEMGLLQMEVAGRPDGEHPGGAETSLDWLQDLCAKDNDFVLTEPHCSEIDREFVQFYHRRICWLALQKYDRAVADSDYTLSLMDFIVHYSPSQEWTLSHEQYRPYVMFQRIQAVAMLDLQESGPEAAIETINHGLEQLRSLFSDIDADEQFEQGELIAQLRAMQDSLRQEYHVGKTLSEQLADAIAGEEYERAARLRDQIAKSRKKVR